LIARALMARGLQAGELFIRAGMPLERLEKGWVDLVARVTGTEPPG